MINSVRQLWTKYREVLSYLFFGGLTTVVNYVVYYLVSRGFSFETTTVPNGIAWAAAVAFAYLTNRTWVFASKARGAGPIVRELMSFVAARVLSGILDVAIVYLLVDRMGFFDLFVKLASNMVVIVINYILSKFWIFRKKP